MHCKNGLNCTNCAFYVIKSVIKNFNNLTENKNFMLKNTMANNKHMKACSGPLEIKKKNKLKPW